MVFESVQLDIKLATLLISRKRNKKMKQRNTREKKEGDGMTEENISVSKSVPDTDIQTDKRNKSQRALSDMEKAELEYYHMFGHQYPRFITEDLDDDEVLKEIRECIRLGVPLLHEPERLQPGVIY